MAENDFKKQKYSTSGHLAHYQIAIERKGKKLEVTFNPDQPQKYLPNEAGTGGGTEYGLEVTYVVSLDRLKILDVSFYR